ncbi:unnamed protein product, partial [Sphacelaria rigidula]
MLFPGAMTAVRVLTRMLPFLLEAYCDPDTGEADADIERLFWSTSTATGADAKAAAHADGGAGEERAGGGEPSSTEVPPLGSAVVKVAMRLLFVRGLTVD